MRFVQFQKLKTVQFPLPDDDPLLSPDVIPDDILPILTSHQLLQLCLLAILALIGSFMANPSRIFTFRQINAFILFEYGGVDMHGYTFGVLVEVLPFDLET